MKKFFFTLIGLLTCLEIFAQLGYRYEDKFIQLTPNTAGPYFVQTRNEKNGDGSHDPFFALSSHGDCPPRFHHPQKCPAC